MASRYKKSVLNVYISTRINLIWLVVPNITMLWIRGRLVAKCDPLLGRVIQHDPQVTQLSDKWEHDETESLQILY